MTLGHKRSLEFVMNLERPTKQRHALNPGPAQQVEFGAEDASAYPNSDQEMSDPPVRGEVLATSPPEIPKHFVGDFDTKEGYESHLKQVGTESMASKALGLKESGPCAIRQEATRAGKAAEYVVTNAIKAGKVASHLSYDVSKSDCLYTLMLTKVALKLPQTERNMLAAVMNHLHRTHCDRAPTIYLPKNGQEMHNTLVRARYSIMNNVPSPNPVTTNKGGYVYVPLADSLRVQFESDEPPNMFQPFSKTVHGKAPRGAELLADFMKSRVTSDEPGLYPVKLILWSDGFQCFNVTVNNDASAHVCFATMGAKDGDMSGKFGFIVRGKKAHSG